MSKGSSARSSTPRTDTSSPPTSLKRWRAARAIAALRSTVTATVTAIERLPGGEWKVSTDKGEVTCEHVVSATGNFARQTGRMVGINVPVIPVEHQYIVTEAHPEIVKRKAQGLPEMGVLRESDSSWYMREEAGGLLLGPYEKGAPACYVDGPSSDSEYELFPEDLDRLGAPHRNRDRARSRLRRGRRQEGLQRRHRLHARRLADRRPSAGRQKFLAQRRPFVRRYRGRRRRLATRRMDRRRRADASTCSASIRAASAPTRTQAI